VLSQQKSYVLRERRSETAIFTHSMNGQDIKSAASLS
jgi:hypothetical protein